MNHKTTLIAVFAVLALFSAPGSASALSNTNRVETISTNCTGAYVKDLTSTDGTFDGISSSQLPADYATPTQYCIAKVKSADCETGDQTNTFALYSTYAKSTYNTPRSCYLPDVDTATSPPRINITTLVYAAPTATLIASPASITAGTNSSALLTWSSTSAQTCTGTGFSTGGQISGSVSVSPTATTQYSVSCTYSTQTASANATVTVVQSSPMSVSCSVNPTSAPINQNVTWTATVTGGTPPYTYLWSGDNLFDITTASAQISYAFSGIKSGAVTVTDSSSDASQSSSQIVTAVADPNCSGTPTGYGGSDMEDGSTPQHWYTLLRNIASKAYLLLPDSIAHPQNYCVAFSSSSSCPANGAGACITTLSWDLYLKNNSTPAPIYIPPTVTSINGDNCTGAPNGACLQGNGGAITWTVSDSSSTPRPWSTSVQCLNSATIDGSPVPQCEDSIDNNNNGLIDIQDPNCHWDGSPTNPNSYVPTWEDETRPPPKPDTTGDNNPPKNPVASLSLAAEALVRPHKSATLSFAILNVTGGSCTLSDDNTPHTDSWTLATLTGSKVTSPLIHETTYTLRCLNLDGHPVSLSKTIKIVPTSGEE